LATLYAGALHQFTIGLIGLSVLCNFTRIRMVGAEGFKSMYFHLDSVLINFWLPLILFLIGFWFVVFCFNEILLILHIKKLPITCLILTPCIIVGPQA
jgi:hypothetical protein